MKSLTRSLPIALATVAAAALLFGCASTTSEPQDAPTSGADANVAVPVFSGAWANEFTSAYRESNSDFEREALADEKITDAEFAELENTFTTCLEDKQVSFKGFKPGGGYDFTFSGGVTSDQANKIADDCSSTTGVNTVGRLYFAMQRNPDNLDEPTVQAACLVKKGVVPKGYGASDYSRDAPTVTFPFTNDEDGKAALDACGTDPLGLLG